jgi:hypothetical protein
VARPITGVRQGSERASAALSLWQLLCSLAASFVFCALIAIGGVLGAASLSGWIVWSAFIGVYWLLFAGLQTYWWHKGYERFWRPVYAWLLFAWMAILLVPLLILLIPSVRRSLERKLKPYDPPGSKERPLAGRELDEAGWFLERGNLGQALKRVQLGRKNALRTDSTELLRDALLMAEALQPKTDGRQRRETDGLIETLRTDLRLRGERESTTQLPSP